MVLVNCVAALPVAQACISALVVLECQSKSVSVNELLPALFDAWSCLHEESAALCIADVCCTGAFMKMGDDLFDESVRRLCEGRYQLV